MPDFLMVGAAKAATTWLSRELARHPDVYVPPREIHYFSRHFALQRDWYEGHFAAAGDAVAVGENSNTYLNDPAVPARIARVLPGIRLIAVLRHPVDRAYSGYCMQFESGDVSPRIDEYLDPARETGFLTQGLYFRHLQRYLDVFDRSQLQISLFDELAKDPSAFLATILRFLGVRAEARPEPGEARNVRRRQGYPGKLSPLIQWAEGTFPEFLERLAGHPIGARLRGSIRSRRVDYPPLTPELRTRMCVYFASDVANLEGLLGRDLTAWRS